jgi:hypothetical protein
VFDMWIIKEFIVHTWIDCSSIQQANYRLELRLYLISTIPHCILI